MTSKLFIAVFYSDSEVYNQCKEFFIEVFGQIEKVGGEFSVDEFTDFYENEMGSGLVKRFLIFEKLITNDDLVEIKKNADDIENKFRIKGKRQINIDPGLISEKELILASNKKGKSYKEKLGPIYIHKVLEFDPVKTFYHTFPDYKKYAENLSKLC